MVKFGLFSKYSNELFQKIETVNSDDLGDLISYLALLLEYDHTYFNELRNNQFERSYKSKKESTNYMLKINIFHKAKVEEEEEEIGKKSNEQN